MPQHRKLYVKKVKENSRSMLDQLNADLERETEDVLETEQSADHLARVMEEPREELKAAKRQEI